MTYFKFEKNWTRNINVYFLGKILKLFSVASENGETDDSVVLYQSCDVWINEYTI